MASLVDRETLPRIRNGVDWGKDSIVLARKGTLSLLWLPGSSYYNMMGPVYSPGKLITIEDGRYSSKNEIYDADDNSKMRLSKKMIQACKDKIDEAFGAGTADLIKTSKTLVLD